MTAFRETRELCLSCVYAADCPHRLRGGAPILCCDRYLGLGAVPGGPVEERWAFASGPRARAQGLCGTCAQRERCKRRYVEGGVWRCADYR